jgi:hypothetical protein
MARAAVCFLLGMAAAAVGCGGRSGLLEPVTDGRPDGGRRDVGRRDVPREWRIDPRCPSAHPEIGDACSPVDLLCNYERCLTEGKSDLTYLCLESGFFWEGRWDCLPNPASCPAQPPVDLSPCSTPDAICRWAPGSKAHCRASDLRWHLFDGR